MANHCYDCRHCFETYCFIKEKKINPDSSACYDFEER